TVISPPVAPLPATAVPDLPATVALDVAGPPLPPAPALMMLVPAKSSWPVTCTSTSPPMPPPPAVALLGSSALPPLPPFWPTTPEVSTSPLPSQLSVRFAPGNPSNPFGPPLVPSSALAGFLNQIFPGN